MLVGVRGRRAVIGIAVRLFARYVVVPVGADGLPVLAPVGGLVHLLQLQIDVFRVPGIGENVLVVVGLHARVVRTVRRAQCRIGVVQLVDVGDPDPWAGRVA